MRLFKVYFISLQTIFKIVIAILIVLVLKTGKLVNSLFYFVSFLPK